MKEDLLVPAIATLFVGLIAGIVSLVVTILSKDQKTSEFRQAWIDGLRDDVSNLVGHLEVIETVVGIVREKNESEINEFLIARHEQFQGMEMLVFRIRLRLNPAEHTKLIGLLSNLEDVPDNGMQAHAELITIEAQNILKNEWERVKRGEPSFVWLKRISKWGVLSVLATGAGVCGAMLFEHLVAAG
ncbi:MULTISPECIES: hypothetical protein [unclassified Pseudomonas]|uniref:hypothetical protein n=1 Tax=unclassified Pseudomonas TaxID=196821 RepID=UPI000A1F6318|nr:MULTISPECIES: hypothetical protein [unclassified Pseudomonas]